MLLTLVMVMWMVFQTSCCCHLLHFLLFCSRTSQDVFFNDASQVPLLGRLAAVDSGGRHCGIALVQPRNSGMEHLCCA
jgi:hypothetical protein